jgi:hypothetical protein
MQCLWPFTSSPSPFTSSSNPYRETSLPNHPSPTPFFPPHTPLASPLLFRHSKALSYNTPTQYPLPSRCSPSFSTRVPPPRIRLTRRPLRSSGSSPPFSVTGRAGRLRRWFLGGADRGSKCQKRKQKQHENMGRRQKK